MLQGLRTITLPDSERCPIATAGASPRGRLEKLQPFGQRSIVMSKPCGKAMLMAAMVRLRTVLLAMLFLCSAGAGVSQAQSNPGGTDRDAIQAVISGQIGAFRADEGAAAYAAASPGIQSRFPSVGDFMAMVAGQYQPVYRPQAVTFGALTDTPDGPVQQVFLVGPDGRSYVAQYLMEKQRDGAFRIAGVAIIPNDQPSI
jgi:hypothetical protein